MMYVLYFTQCTLFYTLFFYNAVTDLLQVSRVKNITSFLTRKCVGALC